jgi:hypothetical protein
VYQQHPVSTRRAVARGVVMGVGCRSSLVSPLAPTVHPASSGSQQRRQVLGASSSFSWFPVLLSYEGQQGSSLLLILWVPHLLPPYPQTNPSNLVSTHRSSSLWVALAGVGVPVPLAREGGGAIEPRGDSRCQIGLSGRRGTSHPTWRGQEKTPSVSLLKRGRGWPENQSL